MGIEIHITLADNLRDVSLGNVSDTFRSVDNIFSEISRYYVQRGVEHPSRAWVLRDTDFYQGSYRHTPVAFDASAGFGFDFGPHVLSIHHHTRLGLFCTEPEV